MDGRFKKFGIALVIRTVDRFNAPFPGKGNRVIAFIKDFNRRFTVTPTEPDSAFTQLTGIDLNLLLTVQHERIVRNDNTVVFGKLELQLPRTKDRIHFARCPVIVHQLLNGAFAISHQGRLVARFGKDGQLLRKGAHDSKAA